jgi:hypothetical protein
MNSCVEFWKLNASFIRPQEIIEVAPNIVIELIPNVGEE